MANKGNGRLPKFKRPNFLTDTEIDKPELLELYLGWQIRKTKFTGQTIIGTA
jgi:hypothetical protein